MRDNRIRTAESVTEGHPDKLCDTIADRVLDACLTRDPGSRVACEVMATQGRIIVAGEITTTSQPDIPEIVRQTVRATGEKISRDEIEVLIHRQSPDIARAVHRSGATLGAGDQGIVYGYACDETEFFLPLPVVLAHRMTWLLTQVRRSGAVPGLKADGKAQVSVHYRGGRPQCVTAVVLSCQHEADIKVKELRQALREVVIFPALFQVPVAQNIQLLVNPSGRFVEGGFRADTGLTGRKLMVDTYGGLVPHGGGALSGKDGTKVDRSGSYMARYIAKNLVAAGLAERCTVSLAYAIGRARPVAVDVNSHRTGQYSDSILEQMVRQCFDLTPAGMIQTLKLDRPIFARFCNYGHFTHPEAPWERTDRVERIWDFLEREEERI